MALRPVVLAFFGVWAGVALADAHHEKKWCHERDAQGNCMACDCPCHNPGGAAKLRWRRAIYGTVGAVAGGSLGIVLARARVRFPVRTHN